jgi:hypothetical protein
MISKLFFYFKKFGGKELLKQYWKAGVLFYAIRLIFLLGISQKNLEIFRLAMQVKIKEKLRRKYSGFLDEFDQVKVKEEHVNSGIIWFCWLPGLENAPILVKRCYESLCKNISNKKIVHINKENLSDYVSFPDYIMEKWEKGYIAHVHFSDLLRVELLDKYGGTWADATVLCTGSNIPDFMLNSNLFVFQNLRPGQNGNAFLLSSWFITASSNNKIIKAVKLLLLEYWKTNNTVVDYFLVHHFFSICFERYTTEWNKVFPYSNSTPHILLLNIFNEYNESNINELKSMCPFHKLSNKLDLTLKENTNSYYDYIINGKI